MLCGPGHAARGKGTGMPAWPLLDSCHADCTQLKPLGVCRGVSCMQSALHLLSARLLQAMCTARCGTQARLHTVCSPCSPIYIQQRGRHAGCSRTPVLCKLYTPHTASEAATAAVMVLRWCLSISALHLLRSIHIQDMYRAAQRLTCCKLRAQPAAGTQARLHAMCSPA